MTAEEIIKHLELEPLPMEGGFYRETYRAEEQARDGSKVASTAIYYMLTPETFSAMHRLPTDEVYHFYKGDPVELLILHPDGTGEVIVLGTNLREGQQPQAVVPAKSWQGSILRAGGAYALMGTTMAPGFEFSDFVAGDRAELSRDYPNFTEEIARRAM